MADFLVPFLTGAVRQYMSDEDASDALKGNIIDNVSKKLYDEEIPQAEKEIRLIKDVKKAVENQYGPGASKAFENMGFFDSGNRTTTFNTIRQYLNDLKKNRNVTEDQFKKQVNKLYTDSQGVGTAATEAAQQFKNQFGGASPLDLRITQLENRKAKVNALFSDRSNIRDLIVSPDAPKEGIRGALFGDRVTPAGVPGAMARITEATKVDTPDVTTEDRDATKSIFPAMAEGEVFDFNNPRHTQRLTQARQNFEKQFYNPTLAAFNFTFEKGDDRQKTADFITAGYDEAVKNGYKLGKVDYAREKYIDYILSSQFGITGYITKPAGTTTQVQPGTAPETQTGPKVTESQTVLGSEDIGAISAKPVEGETAKETIEKTEKITLPKTTKKKEISTGDTLPAPSEIKNPKSLQLANDGFFYTDGKAQMMYKPAEREIEEAQAVAFQIRARDDISDEEKASKLAELRKLLLSELSGMGITQYTPTF
tara:strand:+ start:180 stop:1625 length:1446 start_codon:yes stop_codon:yes gene_type:complete